MTAKKSTKGCRGRYSEKTFYKYLGNKDLNTCINDDLSIILHFYEIPKSLGRVVKGNREAYIHLIKEAMLEDKGKKVPPRTDAIQKIINEAEEAYEKALKDPKEQKKQSGILNPKGKPLGLITRREMKEIQSQKDENTAEEIVEEVAEGVVKATITSVAGPIAGAVAGPIAGAVAETILEENPSDSSGQDKGNKKKKYKKKAKIRKKALEECLDNLSNLSDVDGNYLIKLNKKVDEINNKLEILLSSPILKPIDSSEPPQVVETSLVHPASVIPREPEEQKEAEQLPKEGIIGRIMDIFSSPSQSEEKVVIIRDTQSSSSKIGAPVTIKRPKEYQEMLEQYINK